MESNYLKVLNLPLGSSVVEITKAYRKLARIYHPDKQGSAEKFCELKDAYDALLKQKLTTSKPILSKPNSDCEVTSFMGRC